MLKWLRSGEAPRRVAVIAAVRVDRKRSVVLIRRDNVEHLVMVGGPTDLVIECNIMRRPAHKPAHFPPPDLEVPRPSAPRQEPAVEPPPKSVPDNLQDLTRRLAAGLRRSPPFGRRLSPPRTVPRSWAQEDAKNADLEPGSRPGLSAGAEPESIRR